MSIAALVLGILSVGAVFLPNVLFAGTGAPWYLAFLLKALFTIPGITLAIISIAKRRKAKMAAAIIGLILGAAALLFVMFVWLVSPFIGGRPG